MTEPARGASRSAMLVAACRMLAAELPESERLIDDPFAARVVDERATAAARNDVALQNVIRLRTRYIDDAVRSFVQAHPAGRPQVLLLGAGLDARAFRMTVAADFYEIDFPTTLELKAELLAGVQPLSPRTLVPVDMATTSFVQPLLAAGFDPARPTIVVWEGVINYLSAAAAEAVVAQVGGLLAPGGQLVADYVEMAWFRGADFERSTQQVSQQLSEGGEPLRAGLPDAHGTLRAAGFDVVDDEAVELLSARYGATSHPRHYPARMFTAVRRD
ncbi:MAG: SAM-dependent methyltransferase [Actinomycetota bacterium]|nr:SAM-dependent methyltransferase [Actinomycetota bacterium]